MRLSRRRFLRSTFILSGISVLPSTILSSCLPGRGKRELITAFTGNRKDFETYQSHFKKLSKNKLVFSSLDATLSGESDIVFLHRDTPNKSSYILLLLEQGKDILCSFPLGYTLGEYASISDFMAEHNRLIGILNPLMFYPSVQMLKEIIIRESISIKKINISCNPTELVPGFQVAGLTGTAQALQRVVSYICGSFPQQLRVRDNTGSDSQSKSANPDSSYSINEPGSIEVNYDSFSCYIRFDKNQIGWNMEMAGDEFFARLDHTGMLALNNEVEPRLKPDPGVFEDSLLRNLEDFMLAVRERDEPLVGSLDGLASIVLNKAAEESIRTGLAIKL